MKRNNYRLSAWILLFLFVAVTRFYGLGQRAMSHDESLHTYYSWQYATTGNYQHDPMMHGPLLFHFNALAYAIFGDSDYTSRMLPAFFGVLLIAAVYPFKRYIGRSATLIAAMLLAFAPDIMFYSRYIRNEVYIGFFLLLWIYGIFRYTEKPAAKWLMLISLSSGFSLACKEVSFMHAAQLFMFLVIAAIPRTFRNRSLNQTPMLDIAVFTGASLLPFCTPFLHYALGWDPLDKSTQGQIHTIILGSSMGGCALVCGILWFYFVNTYRKHTNGLLCRPVVHFVFAFLLFWFINLLLYTSLFTKPLSGVSSGIAGGLGYWLAQHDVQRGAQPLYYYLMLLLIYNPALLICTCCGLVSLLIQWAKRSENITLFHLFVGWWVITAFILYTAAGERMPWLLFHITLPMCFLSAIWLKYVCSRINWITVWKNLNILLLLLVPTTCYLLLFLPSFPFWKGRSICDIQHTICWFRAAAAILLIGWLLWIAQWKNRKTPSRMTTAFLGFVGMLFVYTLISALRLTFINYDLPTEHLVFAHGTDRIHPMFDTIKNIHEGQYNPKANVVAYDSESSWPITWYTRNLPHRYFIQPDEDLLKCPVIICGNKTVGEVRRITAGNYSEMRHPIIWWPLQGYMHQTPKTIAEHLSTPLVQRQLRDIILHRRYSEDLDYWPLRHDAYIFIQNKNVGSSSLHTTLNTVPPIHVTAVNPALFGPAKSVFPEIIYDGTYNRQPLSMPRAACMAGDGSICIADTGNNRIVLLNADGSLRATITHPQLKEPWGITVDTNNHLYVADTWNGKIRVFNDQQEEIAFWGIFAQAPDVFSNPMLLYGPRGLAMQPGTNILAVSDTGNKRILLFHSNGDFEKAYGSFGEPVNVAFAPDSAWMAVSEIWKQRVTLINLADDQIKHISVPFWTGKDASFKPYAAIDKQHNVFVAASHQHCVVVYDDDKPAFHFGTPGTGPSNLRSPSGISITADNRKLIIADSGNNRILVFDREQLFTKE